MRTHCVLRNIYLGTILDIFRTYYVEFVHTYDTSTDLASLMQHDLRFHHTRKGRAFYHEVQQQTRQPTLVPRRMLRLVGPLWRDAKPVHELELRSSRHCYSSNTLKAGGCTLLVSEGEDTRDRGLGFFLLGWGCPTRNEQSKARRIRCSTLDAYLVRFVAGEDLEVKRCDHFPRLLPVNCIQAAATAGGISASNTYKGQFENTSCPTSMLFDITVHQGPLEQLNKPVVRDLKDRRGQCKIVKHFLRRHTNQNV
jgi:hypothetical protein